MLQDHNRWTGSRRARELLDDWDAARSKFVKVFPSEYKRALGEMGAKKALQGQKSEEKQAAAPVPRAQAATEKIVVPAK